MESDNELIVIEGIDGAGKSTVSESLCNNYDLSYMTQPEDSWVGEVARKALNEDVDPKCDLFLHMAAHANQQAKLESQLEFGGVVMDRYYHSRVAYQSVQTKFSPKRIEDLHLNWSITPTKTIILDLTPEKALKRRYGSGDKFENTEFLSDVRSVYTNYFAGREDIVLVDATQPEDQVLERVISEISSISHQ